MDLVSLLSMPIGKVSSSFQSMELVSIRSSAPRVVSERSSFMSGAYPLKTRVAVRHAGLSFGRGHKKGFPFPARAGRHIFLTDLPGGDDDSDIEDFQLHGQPIRLYPAELETQILNQRIVENIVKSVIAYYTRRDPRMLRRRVLVEDLPIDPVTQVAIEVNIEKDLEFLLGPKKFVSIQLPEDPNATIGDFTREVYEKIRSSIYQSTESPPDAVPNNTNRDNVP